MLNFKNMYETDDFWNFTLGTMQKVRIHVGVAIKNRVSTEVVVAYP